MLQGLLHWRQWYLFDGNRSHLGGLLQTQLGETNSSIEEYGGGRYGHVLEHANTQLGVEHIWWFN